MKVLLDHNLAAQLKPRLTGHLVSTARQMGWDRVENGDLLAIAERHGFQVKVTGDTNIIYQQNNLKRQIAVILLSEIKRRLIVADASVIREAIDRSLPGGFEHLQIRRILQPIPVE